MAIFYSRKSMEFEDHPLFKGVQIAKLAGKKDSMPVGSSMLWISPGVEIPVHTHDESVDSIYCIRGEGEIFRDGAWNPLAAGDYCLVPAGEEHGVRNTSAEVMELFIIHSPPLF